MRVDASLDVLGEVRIGDRCVAQTFFIGLRERNTVIDGSARRLGCPDDSYWSVILLDDHFGALADFLQHSSEVLRHLRLAHMDLCH